MTKEEKLHMELYTEIKRIGANIQPFTEQYIFTQIPDQDILAVHQMQNHFAFTVQSLTNVSAFEQGTKILALLKQSKDIKEFQALFEHIRNHKEESSFEKVLAGLVKVKKPKK